MTVIKSKWKHTNIEFNKKTGELIILDNKLPAVSSNNPEIINKKDKIKRSEVTKITFKKTPVILPKNSNALFKNFENISTLNLESFDFSKVETINQFLGNNKKLKELNFKTIKNDKIEYITKFINNLDNLKKIHIDVLELTKLKEINSFIGGVRKIPEITINQLNTPRLTKINHIYFLNKTEKTPINYTPNLEILNQLPLSELSLVSYSNFNIIDISDLNIPENFTVATSSYIHKIILPKEKHITPLAIYSEIDNIDIQFIKNIKDLNYLKGCYTNNTLKLNNFKPLTKEELYQVLENRSLKFSLKSKGYNVKLEAGRYKNIILDSKNKLINIIIQNKIIFTDISIKELEPLIIKNYESLKTIKDEKSTILNYINLYGPKEVKRINKKLTIIEQLQNNLKDG